MVIPNLDQVEADVQRLTLDHHRSELAVVESMLNAYLACFREIDSLTRTADNESEQVWLLLTNRSFNDLKWGFHLLTVGYKLQALTLIRSVYESWLVCMDCVTQPTTATLFLHGQDRMPSFARMARRLDQPLAEWWQDNYPEGTEGPYGFLSTFAHPRNRVANSMILSGSDTVRLGPHYEEWFFLVTCYYLTFASIRMAEFLARLLPSQESTSDLQTAVQDATTLIGNLTERAHHLLNEDTSVRESPN